MDGPGGWYHVGRLLVALAGERSQQRRRPAGSSQHNSMFSGRKTSVSLSIDLVSVRSCVLPKSNYVKGRTHVSPSWPAISAAFLTPFLFFAYVNDALGWFTVPHFCDIYHAELPLLARHRSSMTQDVQRASVSFLLNAFVIILMIIGDNETRIATGWQSPKKPATCDLFGHGTTDNQLVSKVHQWGI